MTQYTPEYQGVVWMPLGNPMVSLTSLHDRDLLGQLESMYRVMLALAAPEAHDEFPLSYGAAMWRGYEGGLLAYALSAVNEYERRFGHDRNSLMKSRNFWGLARSYRWDVRPLMPRWFGYRAVHMSHQSTLIRLRPEHYARQWPDVPLDMPLLWPRNVDGHFDFSMTITSPDRRAVRRGELVLNLSHEAHERLKT